MRRLISLKFLAALLVVAATAAGGLWLNRTALLLWYNLRHLDAAAEQDRVAWAERVAELDADAVPALLERLRRDDGRACANAAATLALLTQRWGPEGDATLDLVRRLTERFGELSATGQEAALGLPIALLGSQESNGSASSLLVQTVARLLAAAAETTAPGARLRALALAEILAERAPQEADLYRSLALRALSDGDAPCKARALRLALRGPLRGEKDIQTKAAALLRDPEAEVRRAALLVVGMAVDAVSEDDLLPLLHDGDAEVRRLCQHALRGRGLGNGHLQLAWLISHPEPAMRLEVLQYMGEVEDLDAGVWLRRLSHDPDRAVRVAAVRAAAESPGIDLSDRLREMRDGDPSEAVRGLAAYWLQRPKR